MDQDNSINRDRDPRQAPNEPPDRGSIQRSPNISPEPPAAPPRVEPASQSGRYPTHDIPPHAQRQRPRS